ncbi:MAG TPA: TIGR03885 family FMN-dependent LLM class oxidoreductase [Gaiellaceae bacterium]|nr:TIGR03885 family FMN-dependent LLM class oxidoreductase [Gaiellaceae bacterium]
MASIGFHASHEQAPPSELLAAVRDAEAAGFTRAMCSDHIEPWSVRQGHSGFAWSWLGAALEATSLPFGVVTAPGQRYHPAITAQAAATLAELYPGRFWLALGSGEYMNEHVTGQPWPDKSVRNARLEECVTVIRALVAGEEVDHDGLVRVERARVWSLPDSPPALFAAAVTPETARRVGGWADGLITVNQPPEDLRSVLDEFREGGGEGKPTALQVHLSWAPDEQEALDLAYDQWRTNVFGPPLAWDLATAEQFDQAAAHVRPEDVREKVLVSADAGRHAGWLQELAGLGFDELYLHHVGREQRAFVEAFGEEVLPRL